MNDGSAQNMKSVSPHPMDIESLLGQMDLAEPSHQLDQRINELGRAPQIELASTMSTPVSHGLRHFGWPTVLATALVASIAGVLVGKFAWVEPVNDDKLPVVRQTASIADSDSEITPVKFNVSAFDLLHGHSKQDQYSDCDSCHNTKTDASDMFQGWYYGDDAFFRKHILDGKSIAKCSNCHRLQSEENKKPKPARAFDQQNLQLMELHDFEGSNCFNCHDVGQLSENKTG